MCIEANNEINISLGHFVLFASLYALLLISFTSELSDNQDFICILMIKARMKTQNYASFSMLTDVI